MKKKKFENLHFQSARPKSKIENHKPKKVFAKKSFGQNFLTDQNYIDRIISALDPQPNETIIEIGAGRGALTEKLIESGANVIGVEIERDMIAVLHERFGNKVNFKLIEQDALKINFKELSSIFETENLQCKLVANLPFYISTAILQKLIEQRDFFSEMILMFQREVVGRITAETGSKERGFLTVLVAEYLQTEKLFDVPPGAFRPEPKVWSAVIRLRKKSDVDVNSNQEKLFRELISISFKQKRKNLINNLIAESDFLNKYSLDKEKLLLILKESNIDPTRRAESLTIDEWKSLTKLICM